MAAILDASKPYSPSAVPLKATAVLLLDYHNMMVGNIKDSDVRAKVHHAATSLRSWALSKDVHVYHCTLDLSPDSKPIPTAKLTARWEGGMHKMLTENPQYAEKNPDFHPTELAAGESNSARQVGKFSALADPVLVQDLEKRGIRHLIICGISTSVVVLSTARTATEEGFIVTVASDGCFDPNAELGKTVLEGVLPVSAHVLTSEEIIKEFK